MLSGFFREPELKEEDLLWKLNSVVCPLQARELRELAVYVGGREGMLLVWSTESEGLQP